MCLLIARTEGSAWLPTEDEFGNAWARNSDGVGVAWSDGTRVHVHKTLNRLDAWELVQGIPDGVPALLHWRLGTAGSVSEDNCHPFGCFGGNWIAAHNGVLPIIPADDLTDTQTYLRTLKGQSPYITAITRWLREVNGGKIAFLSQRGELRIANEDAGSWRISGEVWQSNTSLDRSLLPWWGHTPHRSYRSFGRSLSDRYAEAVCSACLEGPIEWMDGARGLCEPCAWLEMGEEGGWKW